MQYANHLLANLPSDDLDRLRRYLQRVELVPKMVLEEAGKFTQRIYFPDSGTIAVAGVVPRPKTTLIGVIGADGFIGHSAVIGDGKSFLRAKVQTAGHGWYIETQDLPRILEEIPSLRPLLLRSIAAFTAQVAAVSLANASARIEERLAQLLLMIHDRVGSDTIKTTHEALSLALSVRRAGITVALQNMITDGILNAQRSQLTVSDRAGLIVRSAGYYGPAEEEHRRLTGWQYLPQQTARPLGTATLSATPVSLGA